MKRLATALVLGAVVTLAGLSVGCAGNPVAPFDSFKSAPMTAFRLQNYEPPQQAFFLVHPERGKTVEAPIFVY